jgi:hypothetical protein
MQGNALKKMCPQESSMVTLKVLRDWIAAICRVEPQQPEPSLRLKQPMNSAH